MTAAISIAELPGYLNRIVATLEHPNGAEAFKDMLPEILGDIGQNFASSHSPDGASWAPLKHPRAKGHNQGNKLLIDTGDLMLSAIGQGGDSILDITPDTLTFGTRDQKAAFHHFGTSTIPARPFMGITDERLYQLAEEVLGKIIAALAA
jgi:phage gpG-like protein